MSRLLLLAIVAIAASAADTQPIALHAKLVLQAPATWQVQTPGPMRAAQMKIVDGAAEAEFVAHYFGPNGAGDVEANITRWVGQLAVEGREQVRAEGAGTHGRWHLVQATGTYRKAIGPPVAGQVQDVPNSAMIAVVLPGPEGPYYLKLTGPKDLVLKQRAAIEAMITAK